MSHCLTLPKPQETAPYPLYQPSSLHSILYQCSQWEVSSQETEGDAGVKSRDGILPQLQVPAVSPSSLFKFSDSSKTIVSVSF